MNDSILLFEERLRAERDAELNTTRSYKRARRRCREVTRLICALSRHVAGWKIDYDRQRDIPIGAYYDVNERLRRWALNHLGAEKKRAYDVACYNAIMAQYGKMSVPPLDETQ